MKKYVCMVCGYVHEGNEPPEKCPICGAPREKFKEMTDGGNFACEHVIGAASKEKVEEDVYKELVANFTGECMEVGMYLAMGRAADREGYPEIAEAFKRYALEEAVHAAQFAELLGEHVSASTKKNLEMRAEAEAGACMGKLELAKLAKQRGYDEVHDVVHEAAKDEARHGAGFKGLLERYFK